MDVLTVAQFKAKFSEVLTQVRQGKPIGVSVGKKKEKVAVLIPDKEYIGTKKRRLGILAAKGSFHLASDFKLTDEEFLRS